MTLADILSFIAMRLFLMHYNYMKFQYRSCRARQLTGLNIQTPGIAWRKERRKL